VFEKVNEGRRDPNQIAALMARQSRSITDSTERKAYLTAYKTLRDQKVLSEFEWSD